MQNVARIPYRTASGHLFMLGFVSASALGAAIIGLFPLQMSIATIFLFAGVHNLMEFRYFVGRVPVRWGRSRRYYAAGIGGVIILTVAYLMLYFSSANWLWSTDTWSVLSASWNSALVLWLAYLVFLRGKQRPNSDWSWVFPAAFLVAALTWIAPQYWSLSLVYIHPLIALWFLERQIRRTKPEWLAAYHYCLASIPLFLVCMWVGFGSRPDLPEDTNLFWRIAQHAGSQILPGISSHLLVATHVFLESIHYFVWLLLIPLIDKRTMPWRLRQIPLFSNGDGFPRLVIAAFVFSVGVVIALWVGFAIDYTTTRDVYFAFAIGHVLAEFPFLIKML